MGAQNSQAHLGERFRTAVRCVFSEEG